MKKIVCLLALLFPIAVHAQTAAYSGFCDQGATSATTSGLTSTNKLQGIIPYCNVEVYLTGTLNKATIYKDALNTPLTNPFQAPVNGQILFYAATGQGYDIVKSGGIPPLTYTTPVTVTDWIVPNAGNAINPGSQITWPSSCTAGLPYIPYSNICSSIGSGLLLEQYGVPVPNQNTLNAGNTPAPPNGFLNVAWQADSAGEWSANYQPANFGNFVTPPIGGNYVILYPTTESSGNSFAGGCTATVSNGTGQIIRKGTSHGDSYGCAVNQSGYSLPGTISPSSVTAIYAAFVSNRYPGLGNSFITYTGISGSDEAHVFETDGGFPMTTLSALFSGDPATFNYSAAVLVVTDADSFDPYQPYATVTDNVAQSVLIVYSPQAPAAPPLPTDIINVTNPITYTPQTNTIGFLPPYDWAADTGIVNAYLVSVPIFGNPEPGTEIKFSPLNSNTISNPVLDLNGSGNATIVKLSGGAAVGLASGDISATGCAGGPCIADVILDTQNLWELQYPATGGGGGGVTSVSVATANGLQGSSSGGSTPVLTLGPDTSHVIPVNTGAATNFLGQDGNYHVPAGTGGATFEVNGTPLISTAPAVNFVNDTNVTITNPSAGNIHIASTGGGGSSNWGTGKTLAILFGSRGVVSSTYIVGGPDNDYGTVTASSVSGSTITMTASNSQVAGNALVLVSGFSACPALIGQTVIVSATGLTTSSLEATNVAGVSSGSCGSGVWAGRDTAAYDLNFTSNVKGAVVTNYSIGGGEAAGICPSLSSYLPSVTPDGTHWVAIGLGDLDADNIPNIESYLQTCWANAHTLGYKVIASTLIPVDYPFNIGNPQSYQTVAAVSDWMIGQGPSSSHIVSGDGQYWDGLADAFSKFRNPREAQLIMQFGCTSPCEAQHLTAAGNLALAGVIDMAAGNLQNPGYSQPAGQNGYWADTSGLSVSSDYEYAGYDSSFGFGAVNYHIMTLGTNASHQYFGINWFTQDNSNLVGALGVYGGTGSSTLGFTPPVSGFPTVGLTADPSLTNTLDVSIPGGAPNPNGSLVMATVTDKQSTTNGPSTVNGTATVNGPSIVNGTHTVTQAVPTDAAQVLKGQVAGIYVTPVPGGHGAGYDVAIPITVPAGAAIVVSCISCDGNTIGDGLGDTFTEVAHIGGTPAMATFATCSSAGGSAVITGYSQIATADAFTGNVTTSCVDGTPAIAGASTGAATINTGNTSPSGSGLLYSAMFTNQCCGPQPGLPPPMGYTESNNYEAGGYNAFTAYDTPYAAGTFSATWPMAFVTGGGNGTSAIILAIKGATQPGDTGDHQQCRKSDGTLQCGITGAGDMFVVNPSAGLILKDTVAGTCSRIQLTSGALVPTVVTCPN